MQIPVICFNSRTRMGCDTHRPAPYRHNARFQFTHPHGVRLVITGVFKDPTLFQFTHPHGVRRASQARGGEAEPCFNSRTRMGCDDIGFSNVEQVIKFQFTHPHGVRRL